MKLIKTCLLVTILAILPHGIAIAQSSSMTDSQVMEFVMKESEKGSTQQQIVTKLIEKGVPVSQIQRIRRKYEREKSKNQVGTRNISNVSASKDRLRSNNGEEKDDKKGNRQRQSERKTRDNTTMNDRQRQLMRERQQDEYEDATDFMFPDSSEIYDEFFGLEQKKPKREIFGRDIFNKKNLTFEPEMNIATPDDYRLGPGDAVYVDVWGASQKNFTATVSPDGNIDIEGYGPVQVSGLTVEQANSRLRASLGSHYRDSNVRLSVGQTRTISVNVMGAVEVPGTYTLSAFATVFHALYMAGGTNEIGSLRDIRVYRNGRQITTVDVYDYILNGNLKGNVRLASGDVIIVNPYACLVNITGKVKRPMFYEMKTNESVATLIKYAGGFTGDAYQQSVRLVRKGGSTGMYSVYTIDEFERNRFQLMDEDSVSVDSVLTRFSNMAEVRGAVFRPGMYQIDGNISTVRQLLEHAGGMTEDAVKTRGVMHRRKADRTLEVLALDLEGIYNHSVADVSLRNEDVLYVPSNKEQRDERKLTISGEVLYPGEYDYADNTTLEDLILQAGGLTDAASLVKVDVSRRVSDNTVKTAQAVIAEAYSFELKDGFVVSGQPGFVLKPYDEVFIRKSPGYAEQAHVEVVGEVAFEGQYVLTKKNYRLSDLLNAAGGLNKDAYPQGARLLRVMSEIDKQQMQSMLKATLTGDSVDVRKLEIGDTRYVGINLDKAIENPGNDQWDIVLQDGDRLTVPQLNNTVSINGEVMYPSTIAYKKGARLSYYINQAGGYSLKARSRRVFAVNMNGTVTRVKSAKDIQPGANIVVPAKSKRRGMSLTEILSLGSITATLAAVVATLVK